MSESKKSFRQQRSPILQKDLSFSNEIFKKSFNPDQLKSNKQSEQNFTKNMIPPLVKYTEEYISKQNIKHQTSPLSQNQVQDVVKRNALNIFTRNKNFGDNFNDDDNPNNFQKGYIPPLSKLEQMISKKYHRNNEQKDNNNLSESIESNNHKIAFKQTKVYFDKTDKLEQGHSHNKNSIDNPLDIDSLEQSRIANKSIERHNNWVFGNVNDSSEFVDGQNILKNMEFNNKKSQRSFALNNQSFRNFNPLNLVANSLHTSNLPQFIKDDDSAQQNHQIQDFNQNQPDRNQNMFSKKVQRGKSQKQSSSESPNKRRQKPIHEITMSLFNHYIQDLLKEKLDYKGDELDTDEVRDSILINEQQQKFGFDNLTSKSSPINNDPLYRVNQNKSMSEADQISRNLDLSIDSYSPKNYHEHFINDKTAQQIIGSILKDDNKLKLFIKYLQIKMSEFSQESQICQNYQLLSCLVVKIQQMSDRNSNNQTPKQLAESILQLFSSRKNKSKEDQKATFFKPQIIRTNNQIRIDFDPYLKYQKTLLNDRISYLKKCIEEKNKSTQLIKLSYDGIVHNYAATLQNLAKKAENNQLNIQNQFENQKQQSVYSRAQMKSNYSQKIQGKHHLDIFDASRSSLEGNKIHRKATFGKVPSSFRGSGVIDL